ncbi:hypothetical protein, partial [Janibacter hoylei]|uniref:hypothetical protein n=1 Tax=Janibacter hoylei TaxID=364298 RepID=UPI00248FC547
MGARLPQSLRRNSRLPARCQGFSAYPVNKYADAYIFQYAGYCPDWNTPCEMQGLAQAKVAMNSTRSRLTAIL